MISLAETLTERARHLRRIIILDCCFAAAAFSAFQAGPDQVALEKTVDAFQVGRKAEGFPTKGTALLCSSNHKSPSLLLPDGSSTMFTKALLDALIQGTPSQHDRFTLRDVKDVATDFLSEIRNAPKPVVHSPDQSEGDVADIPFFPNARIEEERWQRAEEERRRRVEEEQARRQEEERQRRAEEERVRQAEEERRHQAEEEAKLRQAEEQARKIEEERIRRAEEEARARRAEEERVRQVEQERRLEAEKEQARKVEEEAQAPKREESESHVQLFQEPVFLEEERASGGPQLPIGARGISRRAVLVGLAGIAVAGGGITWWFLNNPYFNISTTPLYTYRRHTEPVYAVAWSPDGKRIASASNDKTVQVWNAADGGNVYTYRGHSAVVNSVAWSPNGKAIASASDDKTVQVWNAADGGNVYTYRRHTEPVYAVAWSPDGKRIASGGGYSLHTTEILVLDDTVQVWDAINGGNVYTYHGHIDEVHSVAWSPGGERIASASIYDKTVQVWNAADGGNVYYYGGHSDWVLSVAWSPDGKRIASGSFDSTVQMWNATDGGNVYTLHSGQWIESLAWSPDGKSIASGGNDKAVQVWNASTGGLIVTYKGHKDTVAAVAWSPDGKRIASGSADNTVQVWQAT